MASKTEICNLAISHLGVGKEIANFETERSEVAAACRRYYDIALQTMLTEFDWGFATRYVTLGLEEIEPNSEWRYSYRYPHDCLKVRRIISCETGDRSQLSRNFGNYSNYSNYSNLSLIHI